MHISKSKRCFNVKSWTYYFHMKTKILVDFQMCIRQHLLLKNWTHFLYRNLILISEKNYKKQAQTKRSGEWNFKLWKSVFVKGFRAVFKIIWIKRAISYFSYHEMKLKFNEIHWVCLIILWGWHLKAEAVFWSCSLKKVFLEIS